MLVQFGVNKCLYSVNKCLYGVNNGRGPFGGARFDLLVHVLLITVVLFCPIVWPVDAEQYDLIGNYCTVH